MINNNNAPLQHGSTHTTHTAKHTRALNDDATSHGAWSDLSRLADTRPWNVGAGVTKMGAAPHSASAAVV